MIRRMSDWFWFHRTARRVHLRQIQSINYWMDRAMDLERQFEGQIPNYVVVDDVLRMVIPNEQWLGEFPPAFDFPPNPCNPSDDSLNREKGQIDL